MRKKQTAHVHRSGWSLIEMTVVISLISTFSFVGISLINKLLELDSSLATSAFHQMTTDRLAVQLRTDAEISTEVHETEDGFNLTESTGAVIEYRIQNNLITRKVQRARRVARDSFQFNHCDLSYSISPNLVEFSIEKYEPLAEKSMSSQLASNTQVPVRLLIPVGRQQRYAESSPTKGDDQ
ncbi:MAG: hypothetical protein HON04_11185 [Planctomicrobium sp.]|jgi:hypothetical protein|nr:hypothetical protein [Planctomicrobium sp.]